MYLNVNFYFFYFYHGLCLQASHGLGATRVTQLSSYPPTYLLTSNWTDKNKHVSGLTRPGQHRNIGTKGQHRNKGTTQEQRNKGTWELGNLGNWEIGNLTTWELGNLSGQKKSPNLSGQIKNHPTSRTKKITQPLRTKKNHPI